MLKTFNEYLNELMKEYQDSRVGTAMAYSILGSAKRVRPILLFKTLEAYGIDYHDFLALGAAIEYIHTYSLIHDDLPAMDNDDYRRGRKTCHKEFDEATAILAGDALLTESFGLINRLNISYEKQCKITNLLVQSAGIKGMILGQELDIYADDSTSLEDMDAYKTGCLLALPLRCAGIIADRDDDALLAKIGRTFGLIFQIQDDLIDLAGNEEIAGKSLSDKENDKMNYVSKYGESACVELIEKLYHDLENDSKQLSFDFGSVYDYLLELDKRNK